MRFDPESTRLYTADTAASSIDIMNVDNSSGAIGAGGTVSVSSPPLQLAVYDQFPLRVCRRNLRPFRTGRMSTERESSPGRASTVLRWVLPTTGLLHRRTNEGA
jgi:hypothetical protein